MADWKLNIPQKQYRERSSLGDLADLITGIYGITRQETEKNLGRRVESLSKLITATNDYEKMGNLRSTLVQADDDLDAFGYDEEGDILLQLYDSKYDVMQKGQAAYDALSKMDLEITGQESFDKKRNQILDDDWSVVNKNLRQLFVYQSQLEAAKGVKFIGSKDLDPTMLQATVSQYQGFYANKLSLLARTGAFDIPDESIQEFDEQFGVQLMSLSPPDFNKMMGQHQSHVQSLYVNAESEANRYYDKMVKAEHTGAEGADFPVAGIDVGEILSIDEWRTRYNEKAELARNLNERHNQFYGSYFSKDERFIKGFKEKDTFRDSLIFDEVEGDITVTKPETTKLVSLETPTLDVSEELKNIPLSKKNIINSITRKTSQINKISSDINELQEELNIHLKLKSDNPLIDEYKEDLIRVKTMKEEMIILKKSGSLEDKAAVRKISEAIKAFEYKWSKNRIAKRIYEDKDIYAGRLALANRQEEELLGIEEIRPPHGIYTLSPKEKNTRISQILAFIEKEKKIEDNINSLLSKQKSLAFQLNKIQENF